jgi:hypothetical protein
MRKPCKLWVLIHDRDTRFLGDGELEDLPQQFERISLDLKHLATLATEV